jgi:hypothetical protein
MSCLPIRLSDKQIVDIDAVAVVLAAPDLPAEGAAFAGDVDDAGPKRFLPRAVFNLVVIAPFVSFLREHLKEPRFVPFTVPFNLHAKQPFS